MLIAHQRSYLKNCCYGKKLKPFCSTDKVVPVSCALSAEMHQFPVCVSTAEFHYSHSKMWLCDCKTVEQGWISRQSSWPFLRPFPQGTRFLYKTQAAWSSSRKRCPPLSFISKNTSPKLFLRHLFQVLITQGRFRPDAQGSCRGIARLLISKCPALT